MLQHVLDLGVPVSAQLRGVRLVDLVHHFRVEEDRGALHLVLAHRMVILRARVLIILACSVVTNVASHLVALLARHLLVLGQWHALRRCGTLLEHLLLRLLHLLEHLRWQLKATAYDLDFDIVALLRGVGFCDRRRLTRARCLPNLRLLLQLLLLEIVFLSIDLRVSLCNLVSLVHHLLVAPDDTRNVTLQAGNCRFKHVLAIDKLLIGFCCLLLHYECGKRV